MPTRREFMKQFGIALLSMLATRCMRPGGRDDTPRGRLRDCWLRFDELAVQTQRDKQDYGQQALADLTGAHRSALDELVAADELAPAVAAQVQAAFEGAAYHVWRSNAPITCYEPVIVDYRPTSSGQLARQAELLAELVDQDELDPAVVAQAQAAIERDIAFLNLSSDQVDALYTRILAGSTQTGIPNFDQVELAVTPEAVQAAQFLVDLLLGDGVE